MSAALAATSRTANPCRSCRTELRTYTAAPVRFWIWRNLSQKSGIPVWEATEPRSLLLLCAEPAASPLLLDSRCSAALYHQDKACLSIFDPFRAEALYHKACLFIFPKCAHCRRLCSELALAQPNVLHAKEFAVSVLWFLTPRERRAHHLSLQGAQTLLVLPLVLTFASFAAVECDGSYLLGRA